MLKSKVLVFVMGIILIASFGAKSKSTACVPGVYELEDGNFVTLTRRGEEFRILKSTGEYGEFNIRNSFHKCSKSQIFFEEKFWSKKPVLVTNTTFKSGDALLAGQLMISENADKSTPLVVYAHGSEQTAWIETAFEPYQLLGRGISVFVYDKRGTGASAGQYNQNFPMLAKDLIAASQEAKRLAKGKFGRFGLVGLSQGGWIAPLASNSVDADFIIIGYGLVTDLTEEDSDQVMQELDKMGLGSEEKAVAKLITDATARMVKSNYRDGINELIQLKDKYKNTDWIHKIKGSYTGVLVTTEPEELLTKGIPAFDSLNVDWDLDPVETVRDVTAPQYWALAELDREAPIKKTLERLHMLIEDGKSIKIRIFPNSDHGMWVIGERKIVEGYFDSQADFAKGR